MKMINTRIQKAAFGRTDRMTLETFLRHLDYSRDCPDRINPDRWAAMLTWAKSQGYI